MRKRYVILSAVKDRIRKTTRKYGIDLPTTLEEAIDVDTKNGNHLWRDDIDKEIMDVGIYFELISEVDKPPPGQKKISVHVVFHAKM